ncbi:MAG TPA: HAD-IA family hydrolase [Polyangiaceae bacterium]
MSSLELHSHDAVIFDCDGTLADTMPLHHVAWKSAFAQHGAPFEFTWELLNRRAGMSLERTVEELNIEFGCRMSPTLVADSQRAEYMKIAHDVAPIQFVVDFARDVAKTKPIAVASGSNRASVEDALRRIGLISLVQVIVTPSDVREGKPAPDMFLLAAHRLAVNPSRCLVIEDGELGLLAAARAKMDAFRVDRLGTVLWQPCEREG